MPKKILISDKMHNSIVPSLVSAGFEVMDLPKITREEIIDILPDFAGIIVRSKTAIDKELITAGTNLEFIARSGAGMDQVDVDFAESKGIALLNAPEGNRDAVGEHTVGLMLNLLNNMRQSDAQIRQKIWDREGNRGLELMHHTVGIIGYGNMGSSVAQRLASFGCRVIAYDKYKSGFGSELVEEGSLENIFEETDILSFHIPLTDETRFYVDADFIGSFRKNFFLINTARGEIMKISTLLKKLKSGKIRGAGLDVLENEKILKLSAEQDEIMGELFEMNNVIFTPHVAGWTNESYIKINETLVRKIKALNLV